MKLSERIYKDFLSTMTGDYARLKKGALYEMSYGYLIDLIFEVSDMEARFEKIQEKVTSLDLHLRKLELALEKLR